MISKIKTVLNCFLILETILLGGSIIFNTLITNYTAILRTTLIISLTIIITVVIIEFLAGDLMRFKKSYNRHYANSLNRVDRFIYIAQKILFINEEN